MLGSVKARQDNSHNLAAPDPEVVPEHPANFLAGKDRPGLRMCAGGQVLKDALPTYDIGMLEQMSMVYILMQDPDMIKRMYFEHGYCFNCWYRNMDDPRIDHPAFVVHFAGDPSGQHMRQLSLGSW